MATKQFSIKEILQFQAKSRRKAGEGLDSGPYPFFTSSQIQKKWCADADHQKGSVILGTGGSASVHYSEQFSTSTDVFILAPSTEFISAKYVAYYLLGNKHILDKGFKGAGLKHISRKYVEEIQIPLPINKDGNPDIKEQKRIVVMLEEAERLQNKRVEADQKMEEVIPALFNEMFGNIKLQSRKLGDSISYLTSGARGWAKYYSNESGYKYIRIQNVKDAQLHFDDVQFVNPPDSAEAKRIKVQENDLLISITADLGRTAVVDSVTASNGAYINQHLALVRLNADFNAVFVAHYLENNGKSQFTKYGQAAAKKGLNFDSIKSLVIPCPPIKTQNEFVDKVQKILSLRQKQKESAVKINNLFTSLLAEHTNN